MQSTGVNIENAGKAPLRSCPVCGTAVTRMGAPKTEPS